MINKMIYKMMKYAGLALLLLTAPLAAAHTGSGEHGLLSSIANPLLGIDHLLASGLLYACAALAAFGWRGNTYLVARIAGIFFALAGSWILLAN